MALRTQRAVAKTDVLILAAVAAALVVAAVFIVRWDFFGFGGPGLGSEFTFREQPRHVPRELVKHEKVLTISTGFAAAAALAVDSRDRIYVAGDRAVRLWNSDGKRSDDVLTGLADEPRCLAVDEEGRIYVGIGSGVEVYSPAGELERKLPPYAEKGVVNRIVIDARGIFLAVYESLASGYVVQYDRRGELQRVIALSEAALPSRLLDVAATSDGLRITDPGASHGRIRVYGYDGRRKYSWGDYDTGGDLSSFSGCCNPVHIAALPDGRIVTSEKGAQAVVKVYHRDTPEDHGRLESVVAELVNAEGLDLAVDSKRRILVLDTHSSAVYVYKRTGD
ncbi:MAG: NHL repeat-containing protein [Planctomycetota bacterium]